jgi:predicted dehydrogenase
MAGLGLGIAGSFPLYGKNSPNEKIVIGVMGTNGRGAEVIRNFAMQAGVEVAFVCDVEENALAKGMEHVAQVQKKKPKAIKDFRRMLDEKTLDAVLIASPDHWHAPASIMACAAGKHVYVEKPCGHNPKEGEMLVAAARKYNRIVQMGNQRRSWPNLIQGIQELKEGAIGRTYFSKGWYTNTRGPIGVGKKTAIPPGLDFNLWQGPAPREDFRDNIVHYNWHWFWNWGTGEACNNGTHEIDLMRWAMDVEYPTRVVSAGGRYHFQDDWETPDTQTITFDFADNKSMTWEGRSCNNYPIEGSGRGVIIYGDQGTFVNTGNDDYKIFDLKNTLIKEVKPEAVTDTIDKTGPGQKLDAHHLNNFLDSIRTGNLPNADIESGHKSVLLCHLGNIAQRVGRALNCDPENGGIIKNDPVAMGLWSRAYESGWEPVV